MKDYLYGMFTNIKNCQTSKRMVAYAIRTKLSEAFLKILWKEGYIIGYKICSENNKKLKIFLKYIKNKPSINSIKFLSKPGKKLHYSAKQIWKQDTSKSFLIFSTSIGLKTGLECKKLKIGGKPFITIN